MVRYLVYFFAGTLLSGLFVEAHAAEMVVISSSSPDVSIGHIVEDGGTISVVEGANVVLISPDGGVTTIDGPYSGAPGQNTSSETDTSLVSSLANLLTATEEKTVDLGVMRSFGTEPPYVPWSVNVTVAGNQCILAEPPPDLWRPKTSKSTMLIIENSNNGDKAEMRWASDRETLSWPAEVRPLDGATYTFYLKTLDSLKDISLFVMPDVFPSDAHKVAWMAEQGCIDQAKKILSTLN